MALALATAVTFAAALGLTPLVRALAQRTHLVAVPRADRWHRRPTALLGGVAIAGALAVGLLTVGPPLGRAWPVVAAAGLLFVVGLVDDARQITPATKLAAQLCAAGLVVGAGLRLPWTHHAALDALLTVVWMVGITNAVNLLDNMDGLAAGIAVIASGFLATHLVLNGQADLALLPALVGGAAAGFLVHNFKPASVFMGDCGAMLLGAMLAGIALLADWGRSRSLAPVVLTPVLVLLIPILDTSLVTITRKFQGRPVSEGGRDHSSHRLVALGASERRAVLMLYAAAVLSGLFALAVRWLHKEVLFALVPCFAVLVVIFGLYLGTVRIDAARRAVAHGRADEQAPVTGLERSVQVALDAVLAGVAWYGAHLIRFGWTLPVDQWAIVVTALSLVVAVEIAALAACGVYRDLHCWARRHDLVVIVRGALVAALAATLAVEVVVGWSGASRLALLLNANLLLTLTAARRLSFRLFDALVRGPRAAAARCTGAIPAEHVSA